MRDLETGKRIASGFFQLVLKEKMDNRVSVRFRVVPLNADNCFLRFNDVGIILQGKELWKYVKNTAVLEAALETRSDGGGAASNVAAITTNNQKSRKRDVALAYLLASIDSTCKSIVRQMRCPANLRKH